MDAEQLFNAILDAPTCYPEKERKSREQRKADLIYWYEKYNDVNDLYNLWGMDCTDATNLDEWLDRSIFRKQRHDINAFVYPNGPHVIEGNDGWDMALYQSIKGCRMRPMWNEMVAKHKAYYNK